MLTRLHFNKYEIMLYLHDIFTIKSCHIDKVITIEIDKFAITKVLVDQGSSMDILYWKTFKKMRIPETEIQSYDE